MKELYLEGKINRVVIFTPNSILVNWEMEINSWLQIPKAYYRMINLFDTKLDSSKLLIKELSKYHNDFKTLSEARRELNKAISREEKLIYDKKQAKKLLIILVNYEKATHLVKELTNFSPQMIINDESHNLKNHVGKQAKAVRLVANKADYRINMTGTPMIQGPQDLYMQYSILGLDTFENTYGNFEEKYLEKGGFNGKVITGYKRGRLIKRKLKETMFRVRLSDVVNLPNLSIRDHLVEINPKARKYYKDLEKEMITTIDRDPKLSKKSLRNLLDEYGVDYENHEDYESLFFKAEPFINSTTCELVVTQLIRLQQIAGGFITLDTGEIIQVCKSKENALIAELGLRKSPTIIFCRFVPEIESIQKRLLKLGKKVGVMRGPKSPQVYKDFRAGKYDILILQIQSGSVGLNLQRADGIIFYSWDFSAGNYIQAIARIRRRGQENPMEIIHIKANKTVDSKIKVSLDKKINISTKLLDS